jgi:hypothetical protein
MLGSIKHLVAIQLKIDRRVADHKEVIQSAQSADAGVEPGGPIKVMKLRYAGKCCCGQQLAAGSRAGWNSLTRAVICEHCLALSTSPAPVSQSLERRLPVEVDVGRPGASLARQYHQRAAQREARIRREHPRIGGLILALSDEPQSTRAFASGALGEQKAAHRIVTACGPSVLFLHNRGDEAFIARVHSGESFSELDVLRCLVRETQTRDERGLRASVEVLEVLEHLPPVQGAFAFEPGAP